MYSSGDLRAMLQRPSSSQRGTACVRHEWVRDCVGNVDCPAQQTARAGSQVHVPVLETLVEAIAARGGASDVAA
jgi:hypothetical protein